MVWLYILFVIIGYGMNGIVYQAYCSDPLMPGEESLARILKMTMIIPFLPCLIMVILAIGLLLAMLVMVPVIGLITLLEVLGIVSKDK